MEKWMVNALKISVALIGAIILLLSVFWLPYIAKVTIEIYPEVAYLRYPILFGIYLTCIPFYIGIFQTFNLLNLIKKENAFTEDACKSLKIITFSAIFVIIIYIIGVIYLNVENALPPALLIIGLIIIFISFIIAVFAAVLRALLMKVVEIKNENDFTI